jgi:hypothetical protein
MALENFQLPFNLHTTQQMPIRNRPDRYAQTPLAERFRFEVSEGVRPAEYMGVYKYLPVQNKDITTEDYIVIPKGRIVSGLSSMQLTPTGGIVNPVMSGSVYSFRSNTTDTFVTRGIDSSYFGYDDYMTTLIVPANNGTTTTHFYTSDDVTATTITASGTYAAAADEMYVPANYPIGVVYHDWYQDIRGKWLNYRMWPDGGHVLCDWFVEVPFVQTQHVGLNTNLPLSSGNTPQATLNDYTTAASLRPINKKFTYLTVNADTETFVPGVFISSDYIGNYGIQGVGNRTVQTVGRLVGIDTRFPKAGLDDVQTYPGSDMPGTQTAGLPSFLFEFVKQVQTTAEGTVPTVENILRYVEMGAYGVARIQLSVA